MITEKLVEMIESKATEWNVQPYYRFYFIFRNHRYALRIAEQNKQSKINNGMVTAAEKTAIHFYTGCFTTLDKAFNVTVLNDFFQRNMKHITVENDKRQVTFTDDNIVNYLGFNPTTTILIEREYFENAVTIAKATTLPTTKGNRELIVKTLTDNGFWFAVKNARIVGKSQRSLNRHMALKPLYEAMRNPKTFTYQSVYNKVLMMPDCEYKTLYLGGLNHNWKTEVIVIDWQG